MERGKPIKHIRKAIILVLLISAGLGAFAFFTAGHDKPEETQVVKKQDVLSTISSTGTVTVDTILQVNAEVSNKIKALPVKEGERFKQGDVLAEFDNTAEAKAVEQGEANLKIASGKLMTINNKSLPDAEENLIQASIAYEKAKSDYDKTKALADAGSLTAADLENSKVALDLAKSKMTMAQNQRNSLTAGGADYKEAMDNIQQSKVALDIAENSLKKTVIRAPFDGIVLKKQLEPGELAALGKEILTIAKNQETFVKSSVDEKYLSRIALKKKVLIRPQGYGDKTVEGFISKISPAVDSKTGTVDLDIRLINSPDFFKINMTVNVEIVTNQLPSALVVDKKFISDDQKKTVWKLENGVVKSQDVQVSLDLGDRVVITSGVSEGDVLLPKNKYKTGQKLKIKE